MNENQHDGHAIPMGTHLVHLDGDTLVLIARGTLSFDDMKGLLDHFVRIKREHGRLFVLYDGVECTGIDADARKLASQLRSEDANANLRVAFGVPFTIRVLANMIIRAQKVLTNRDVRLHLFDHENEARAFFEKERDQIRRALGVRK